MLPAPRATPTRTARAMPHQPEKPLLPRGMVSSVAMLLVLVDLGPGDQGDVLGPQPVGRIAWNALERHLGIDQGELGRAFEIVALGRGQRRTRLIPFAIVDDA